MPVSDGGVVAKGRGSFMWRDSESFEIAVLCERLSPYDTDDVDRIIARESIKNPERWLIELTAVFQTPQRCMDSEALWENA